MAEWDYRTFWDESLSQLKNELGEEEYSIWFEKVEYLRAEEGVIYASVPSKFFLGVFGPKYLPKITSKIDELTGKTLNISLEVQKKKEKPQILLPVSPPRQKKSVFPLKRYPQRSVLLPLKRKKSIRSFRKSTPLIHMWLGKSIITLLTPPLRLPGIREAPRYTILCLYTAEPALEKHTLCRP